MLYQTAKFGLLNLSHILCVGIDQVNISINALINSTEKKTLCVEAKQKNIYKILAVTRATRDVILKRPA